MKKLNLNQIKVKSFVTSLESTNVQTVKGGVEIETANWGCTTTGDSDPNSNPKNCPSDNCNVSAYNCPSDGCPPAQSFHPRCR